jgi:hypothetical protein
LYAEGFDRLFYVWINDNDEFVIEDWKDEFLAKQQNTL